MRGFEFAVADALTADGLVGYAPHKVVVYNHARRNGSNSKRRRVEVDFPVMPGYVIVGCPAGRYVARGDLILRVCGDMIGRPGVSQLSMDQFNALHCAGKLGPLAPRAHGEVAVGDVIEAEVAGRMLVGIVTELRKAGVIGAEFEMFGSVIPVEIGFDKIKAAAV